LPGWASSAIWYSVYPLGACGAPIRTPDDGGPHHRLNRLEPWLDHIIALGANGLALGPIWASDTHGYDVIDHDAIDARLGDEHDFDHLIDACHQRGLRVLLDGVFNHVSDKHADVIGASTDPASAALFRHDASRPDGLSRFEGHDGLIEYDHTNPAVADRVVATMTRWLQRGADGWRLDAAYRVPPEFWAGVIARVKAQFPQCLMIAEVLHGDYAAIAADFGVDSVTQYELWKAIWSSLHDHNPHELLWALQRHAASMHARPGHFLPWTFVDNHDVTRIVTQVGPADARIAVAILMTLPGMPAVYYGDEFGFTGEKLECLGGDDAIRPALPNSPDDLLTPAGQSRLDGESAAVFGDPAGRASMMRHYQLLIGLRRRADLAWAGLSVDASHGQQMTYRVTPRSARLGSALTITLDASGEQNRLTISDAMGVLIEL